jgi:oligopeptidase B
MFKHLPNAPLADKRPTKATVHSVTLHDDFAWLRADNWQEAMRDPTKLPEDIADYLRAENAYYDAAMADTADLQAKLIAEMRGRIKEDDTSVPRKNGAYAYVMRYSEGAEHPVYIRTPRDGGDEVVLLDVNAEAAAHEYFDLGAVAVSPDHGGLAWKADTTGSEFFTLRLRHADRGCGVRRLGGQPHAVLCPRRCAAPPEQGVPPPDRQRSGR